MRRKSKSRTTMRFSPTAADMIAHVAKETGWSNNVVANRLIEIGCYYFSNTAAPLERANEALELAIRKHQIELDAAARIAALKNLKPSQRPNRPIKGAT